MSIAIESKVVIRDIDQASEMRAVEELQKEVWRVPDLDVVPLSQLVAARVSGGILLGAFDGDSLVGFVYGFVGRERDVVVHHSHMLAVKPGYRSHDLGFRLKAAQRERALAQGITVMTWTFDPLQSLNAHFNFTKLGVIADQYFVDFYGDDAASFLHQNGTDRLWVTWLLDSVRVRQRISKTATACTRPDVPALVELGEDDRPHCNDLDKLLKFDQVVVEIPTNITEVEEQDREVASEWRLTTRRAFTEAFAAGFTVRDFYRTGLSVCRIGGYVLTRKR